MTAEEHIIAWIESSQPHYRKLLHISVPGNFLSDLGRAHACMNLAAEAYREMIKGGDAWASDHDASTIIGAALAISKWELCGRERAPVCPSCGNDGTQGALYIAIDARWSPEKQCWILEARDDQGGRVLDCLACDHNEPDPEFPYGLEVQP